MAKAQNRTLKQRFKRQAKNLVIAKGGVSRSGKKLSQAEIGRRALARAERAHAAAKTRKKNPGSAALRAFKSTDKPARRALRKRVAPGNNSRAVKVAIGKSIRNARLARGSNPNTGKAYTAKQLGLRGERAKSFDMLSDKAKQGIAKGTGGTGKRSIKRGLTKPVSRAKKAASKKTAKKTGGKV